MGALALAGCDKAQDPQTPAQQAEQMAPVADAGTVSSATEQAVEPAVLAIAPEGQLSRDVVPAHYKLNLTLVPTEETFSGSVSIDVEAAREISTIYLHGKSLDVTQAFATVGERQIDATYTQISDGGLSALTLAEPLPAGDATLHMTFNGRFNESLEGLYRVKESNRDYIYTQFEAVSARLAFPGFDDPQFKTTFDTTVTAKSADVVITNTPQAGVKSAPNGLQTRTFARSQPMPTYLLAFAVGPMDVVEHAAIPPNAVRQRPIPLRGTSARGKGARLAYALENTAPILDALENYFGVEYPYAKLDILAAPDFGAGAMENVGAIIYREQLLLLDENAPVTQRRWYGLVHAHELAHQWFGNLVTPQWWSDIWLNEAFATWMASKAADAWNPELEYSRFTQSRALQVMATDSLASARQIRQPVLNNNDIANAFDGITYSKGGGVLAMFESYLGEERFRDGVRLHMQRFRFGVASSDDFMRSLADGSGEPGVVPAFRSFIDQPGVPQVDVSVSCQDDTGTATIKQSRHKPLGSSIKAGQQWQIPVCLRVLGDTEADRSCMLLTENSTSVDLGTCPTAVMPNADGAGYYRWALDEAAMTALLGQLDRLNEAELLSLTDSVNAGYRAGKLSAEMVRDTAAQLAGHPNWEVATALVRSSRSPHGLIVDMHDVFADNAAAQELRAWISEIYGPRLAAIGLAGDSEADAADPNATGFLRNELLPLLALTARDEVLRAELTTLADAYIGERTLNPAVINADITNTALRVAVAERGEPLATRLRERLAASTDAIARERMLTALARAPQPGIAAKTRELVLDDSVRDNEAIRILRDQFAESATREAAWTWLQANFEPVLNRVSEWNHADLIALADDFCSTERLQATQTFFADKKDRLQGGPREYALTTEAISLCTALKDQRGPKLNGVFEIAAAADSESNPANN